jgi:hypothetical protein
MFRGFAVLLSLMLWLMLFSGCATQKIDWTPRVGKFTYDQSVVELGPPDKKEKLQDGTVVAEWLTRRGFAYSAPETSPYWWHGPFYPEIETTPNWYLRLIFSPDGKLKEWKNFVK